MSRYKTSCSVFQCERRRRRKTENRKSMWLISYQWNFLTSTESLGQVWPSGRRSFTRRQTWPRAVGETDMKTPPQTTRSSEAALPEQTLAEFVLWYLIWGSVCADSVWSAAHSQPAPLQRPLLVQSESGGIAESGPASEPRPTLSGKTRMKLIPSVLPPQSPPPRGGETVKAQSLILFLPPSSFPPC